MKMQFSPKNRALSNLKVSKYQRILTTNWNKIGHNRTMFIDELGVGQTFHFQEDLYSKS